MQTSSNPLPVTRRGALEGALAAGLCMGAGNLFAVEPPFTAKPRVRPFIGDGKTPIPLLGLGCAERFPLRTRDAGQAAMEARAEEMVDFALAHGVTWIDTGYSYHRGKSEPFLGRVLKKHPRDSYLISTKMPTWLVRSEKDAPRIFNEQLQRLNITYFDFYLLHSIRTKSEFERVYLKLGVLDFLREQKKLGRIRHLGLSFHGKSDYLKELLETYPGVFEVCMVMQNAMEYRWNKDAPKLAEVAAQHKVAILVMEPLAGGRAAGLSGESLAILKRANPKDSSARWGFRFAASIPGVACVFSGMGKLEYLKENIETLTEDFKPLSPDERKTYEAAIAEYMKYKTLPCTGCAYCVPCPYGVKIPEIFRWYNTWAQSGRLPADEGANDSQDLRRRFLASYYNTFKAKERADRCIACRKCLVPCPQWTFRIPTEMENISELVARTEATYIKKGGVIR
ncbi:MAG: aldo/keto reductase [Kiritimatiellae bacterium]|nr:aldo/keto reductase [Kiritimatiellia bacterium]